MRYEDAVDELYQSPHDAFVAERRRLVAALKAAGDADGAARLSKVTRPTASAWAVDQLWWHARRDFEAMFDTAAKLRAGDFRAMPAHREAMAQLRSRASKFLEDAGHEASDAVMRRVMTTLAALAAEGGFGADRPGTLAVDRESPGFGAGPPQTSPPPFVGRATATMPPPFAAPAVSGPAMPPPFGGNPPGFGGSVTMTMPPLGRQTTTIPPAFAARAAEEAEARRAAEEAAAAAAEAVRRAAEATAAAAAAEAERIAREREAARRAAEAERIAREQEAARRALERQRLDVELTAARSELTFAEHDVERLESELSAARTAVLHARAQVDQIAEQLAELSREF